MTHTGVPADRVEGEVLPGSCRYLRLVLGTVVALLCLRHFFTLHRLSDLRSPLMRICVAPSFFRNFFSTYLALIQASFSCLRDAASVRVAGWWRPAPERGARSEEVSNSYLELDGNGFFRPWSRYEPS